jgi:MFS family permease
VWWPRDRAVGIIDAMPPDQQPAEPTPIEPTPDDPGSMIEFGPQEKAPRRSRFSVTAWAAGLAGDRRMVPLAAALGAVALFASLVSEWQVTTVDATLLGDFQVGTKPLPATIAGLGAWGGGYLAGLFPLVAAVVLVLFGPAPGRRYARLAGLSAGGVLLGLLAAVGAELRDTSRVLGEVFMVQLSETQVQLSYGRGLWCALFGVAAVTLALYLAGRHLPAYGAAPAARSGQGDAERAVEPVDGPAPVWSWRRPHGDEEDDPRPEEPFDLTVTSTKPFTPSTEDRDQPR